MLVLAPMLVLVLAPMLVLVLMPALLLVPVLAPAAAITGTGALLGLGACGVVRHYWSSSPP